VNNCLNASEKGLYIARSTLSSLSYKGLFIFQDGGGKSLSFSNCLVSFDFTLKCQSKSLMIALYKFQERASLVTTERFGNLT
jgi:hypothetical protein